MCMITSTIAARADHISGGEIYYICTGKLGNNYQYEVYLRLFMLCTSPRQFDNPATLSVFNKATYARVIDVSANLNRTETISLTNTDLCISNPPRICYKVGYYQFNLSLPVSADGYILSYQVNFRVDGMNNLAPGYNRIGATFTAEIPGIGRLASAAQNNSAKFGDNDLAIVCANNSFTYSFAAKDPDGDELHYALCDAYASSIDGGFGGFGDNNEPPGPPPYRPLPYGGGYSGGSPLGNKVKIDPKTGMITGVAPGAGVYVIDVCVSEYRNGIFIAMQRRDLQITIAPCTIAAAELPDAFMLCKESKTVALANSSISPLVNSYTWQITNSNGASLFNSTDPLPTYTFADTGTYKVTLIINSDEECVDTASSLIKVYPGFKPAFDYTGICFTKPTQFKDATTTVYGQVNGWQWNLNNSPVSSFIAEQNPVITYSSMGAKQVWLIASNTVGCIDTVIQTVDIVDKPPLNLAFTDTLICLNDTLQLKAGGNGMYVWSPVVNMLNANTATPTVQPTQTTTYYVDLDDNGCLNRDSVKVNVVDHVTLQLMNDTVICANDPIVLRTISDGLLYNWAPTVQLNNAALQSPVATTPDTTRYHVTAIIGSCSDSADVTVYTVPYPVAYAGADTLICYGTPAQLHGSTDGSSVTWTPSNTLENPATLNPLAHPTKTGDNTYLLAAYDTKGCPKPGTDEVVVTMLPDINAFAGRDTTIILGQPLQLEATGGTGYQWSPAMGLSSTSISNPVATHYESIDFIRYKVIVNNQAGCLDSAFIGVRIFKTRPSVFVPTGFTPNGDGRNDVLRPIAAGMQRMEQFAVFNRWGQMVFTTSINGLGWDGTVNGKSQPPGVFVWMVKATDYTGRPYLARGTVTLIR